MKFSSTFVAFGMLQAVLAQSIAPSPTESIGCEPHGDHWHCEGPRPTEEAADTSAAETSAAETTAAATTSAAEEEADDDSSVDPGPSPTESEGCEPHGDHWHCDGPAETGVEDDADETDAPEAGVGALSVNIAAVVGVAAFALA